MIQNVQTLKHNLTEIKEDWPESTFDEKEQYVCELTEMHVDAAEMLGVDAAELRAEVGLLRDHIEGVIRLALQGRETDLRRRDAQTPAGESL